MHKRREETFAYRGYHGCESRCRLRVWEEAGKPPVVLFTEMDDNPGTSITNRIERLAWEAYKLLERPETGLVVIEHYPQRGFAGRRALFAEHFDLVTFTTVAQGFERPVWRRISKEEVERIIGQTLEA